MVVVFYHNHGIFFLWFVVPHTFSVVWYVVGGTTKQYCQKLKNSIETIKDPSEVAQISVLGAQKSVCQLSYFLFLSMGTMFGGVWELCFGPKNGSRSSEIEFRVLKVVWEWCLQLAENDLK